jgi:hypothetical protein
MTINFPHGKQVSTPFDLKAVKVGKDVVHARPVAWDRTDSDGFGNDEAGNPINAVRFNTTCPACAQLMDFGVDDLFKGTDGSDDNLVCISCKAGVDRTPNKPAALAKVVEAKAPFVDPVANKLMSTSLVDDNSQPFKVDE